MQKQILRVTLGGLLALMLIALIVPSALAMNREVAENPLKFYVGKPAQPLDVDDVICNVGFVHNRITNSTYETATNTNDWTILMGDDSQVQPSMVWLYPPDYTDNSYLYFASLRVGSGLKLVKFSTDTSPGITVNQPGTISAFDTYFSISDQSSEVSDQDKLNIEAHSITHAWSETYRDDFIIYDYRLINLDDTVKTIFVGWHADADISTAEGGSGTQAYSRDDMPGYYRDDANNEYISYLFDSDNPFVGGNDQGGSRIPKESSGYIGSRLLYCPPIINGTEFTEQQGHGWWDWNSDPGTDAAWMSLISDGRWLDPPPSPHDYRYLQKLGPFSLAPHDSIRIVYAFGVGEGLEGLRANLDWAARLFEANWVGPSAPPSPTFTIAPGDKKVTLTWNTNSETTPDPATGEIDFEGYRLWRKTGVQGSWSLLMECDIVNDIGHNTGLVHEFVDNSVNNGFLYYYVVTAYDTGDPISGIPSLESGREGIARSAEPGRQYPTENAATAGIHVVPNPFVKSSAPGYGFTPSDTDPSTERITFVNLPQGATAKITVYSLTGDEVIVLEKTNVDDARLDWNMITRSSQKIVAGMYLYVVESSAMSEDFIGKFVIVR